MNLLVNEDTIGYGTAYKKATSEAAAAEDAACMLCWAPAFICM